MNPERMQTNPRLCFDNIQCVLSFHAPFTLRFMAEVWCLFISSDRAFKSLFKWRARLQRITLDPPAK